MKIKIFISLGILLLLNGIIMGKEPIPELLKDINLKSGTFIELEMVEKEGVKFFQYKVLIDNLKIESISESISDLNKLGYLKHIILEFYFYSLNRIMNQKDNLKKMLNKNNFPNFLIKVNGKTRLYIHDYLTSLYFIQDRIKISSEEKKLFTENMKKIKGEMVYQIPWHIFFGYYKKLLQYYYDTNRDIFRDLKKEYKAQIYEEFKI